MTVSDDYFVDEGEEYVAPPTYPTIFGITLTPTVSGILLGVLGVFGALYMLLNFVLPAWDAYQANIQKRDGLQADIERKKASIGQIGQVKAELARTKQQKAQVLALFSNEKTIDTLVLDVNRLVEASNAQRTGNAVRARMTKYEPAGPNAEIIADGSYGSAVNGKLKRRVVKMELAATYDQTQAILRNIERLQPLLIVREYDSKLTPAEPIPGPQGIQIPRGGPEQITTSFRLESLEPLTAEESAKAAAAASAAKQPAQ